MTAWHADQNLLEAYAHGSLDRAQAASVEQHLTRCAGCRDGLASHADRGLHERAWSGVIDVLDRPRRSLFERALIGLGLSPNAARLAAGASAARRAWVAGCVLVTTFALAARYIGDSTSVWFLAVAPLAPLTGVIVAYGPGSFPMYDVVAAAPYPPLRLVLLRCLPVLPMTAALLVASGLILPGTELAALWLLPGLALAVLGLAVEPYGGSRHAVTGVALLWASHVAATRIATGSVLNAFSPAVQVLSLLITVGGLIVAVVAGRTRRLL